MYKIAICDDDYIILKQVEDRLKYLGEIYAADLEIHKYNDGILLQESLKKGIRFDLIYLDIEMKRINGIETARYIRKFDKTTLIIYMSSYESYLKELFEVEPFRFMEKPISKTKFDDFFLAAIKRIKDSSGMYMFKFNKDIISVSLKDVIFFESSGSVINVILENKEYKFYKRLDEVEHFIKKHYEIPFLRIHQSFLINYLHITKISYSKVEMSNGRVLQISEKRQKEIRKEYGELVLGDIF